MMDNPIMLRQRRFFPLICSLLLLCAAAPCRAADDPLAMAKAAFEAGHDEEAVNYLTNAAAGGNAKAQYHLGTIYERGRAGVTQDYQKAFDWFSKAAAQGYAAAENNLGNLYYKGNGVPQDYAKAFDWYSKASSQDGSNAWDQSLAWSNLGSMYY